MSASDTTLAQQVAQSAIAYQEERTGRVPASVTVALRQDTLVITLHDALRPAEEALALSAAGAAQVQEYHRQLFLSSADALRSERRESPAERYGKRSAEVEPASGAVVHAFTTGNVV